MEVETSGFDKPSAHPAEGSEILPASLSVHNTWPTQTAVAGFDVTEVSPTNAITNATGTIEITWTSGNGQWIDIAYTYVKLGLQIKSGNGQPLQIVNDAGDAVLDAAKVIPVNGISHAVFGGIEVSINGKIIDDGDKNYPYRADLETRLTFPAAVKKRGLLVNGWYEEPIAYENSTTREHVNFLEVNGGTFNGEAHKRKHLLKRWEWTKGSKSFHVISHIHSDIFDQPKWLPPGTKVTLRFSRAPPAFCLLNQHVDVGTPYKIEIEKMSLFTRLVCLDPRADDQLLKIATTGQSYTYPMRRVKVFSHALPLGTRELAVMNPLIGEKELPRRLFCALVHHDAHSGSLAYDPFNYCDFKVERVALLIGGAERPYPALVLDYPNDDFIMALRGLLDTVHGYRTTEDIGINRDNYNIRNVIYGFDLTGTQTEPGVAFERTTIDTVRLAFRLREAATHMIYCVIYAEYEQEMEITPDGKVILYSNGYEKSST